MGAGSATFGTSKESSAATLNRSIAKDHVSSHTTTKIDRVRFTGYLLSIGLSVGINARDVGGSARGIVNTNAPGKIRREL
ncbi:hypothetical protein JCM17478_11090 [Thermopirellula anaerolimosa]